MMGWSHRILRSNFAIKLLNWEYWPFGIVQFPIFFYWAWLSLRSRSITFFSATNPGILMGGMFGESKYDVILKLPKELVPKTILIRLPITVPSVLEQLRDEGFSFPVIFKPELGERGYMVKRIHSPDEVVDYVQNVRTNFLVQKLVDLPLEFGVFYTRFPNEKNGKVTSVVMKEMLSVTGDGQSTLKQLILNKDRAKLRWDKLKNIFRHRLDQVLAKGDVLELVSIGNHAQGTKFLDGSKLITEKLSTTFDRISKQIEGFYFGRFDLRCATLEDLYNGNVQILELNGCGAEPAHIYDPDYSMFKAIRVLLKHWKDIFVIAMQNHERGVPFISVKKAYALYKKFKALTK